MLFFIHMLLFDYLSLYIHSIFIHPPALSVSAHHCVVTDLQAHAHCKHKQLAITLNPNMVLWQWMDMFNQYNPLNRDGRRLLQG